MDETLPANMPNLEQPVKQHGLRKSNVADWMAYC